MHPSLYHNGESVSLIPTTSSLPLSLFPTPPSIVCDVSLDMVFMLDRSGSVGEENFDTAITFLQNVVNFFTVARDATRVCKHSHNQVLRQPNYHAHPGQSNIFNILFFWIAGWVSDIFNRCCNRI